ncbi:hypothetical protein F0U62_13255 [Cystobacter fuscus]|uniref:hypothetical protein n=1 Tax=Cystobacter fuscus TaxID=43 RepID=UPI002B2C6BFD|nr:hypothetical protein F0U62_13255 [Cystobacter fuscus]
MLFDSSNTLIDDSVQEHSDAQQLNLPQIPLENTASSDGVIDAYAAMYGFEELAKLIYLTSPKGLGYKVEPATHWIEDWEVDHDEKTIYVDNAGVFSGPTTNQEAAEYLKDAIERDFEGKENFWDAAWRVTKGAGITVLGTGEMIVGVIGILVPEPTAATKVAGAAVFVFGASTAVEGVTQIFNVNNGKGVNPIEEGFAAVGDWVGGGDGELWARRAFVFTNIFVSLGGSYSILKVPNTKFLMKGTVNATGKVYKEGYTVGRLQLFYDIPNAGGKVFINVLNNSGQWVIRFQTVSGKLVMNGRIINTSFKHRIENPLEMLKFIGKLCWHGFKVWNGKTK